MPTEHTFTAQEAEEMFSENVMLKFDIIENQSNMLIANVNRLSDMYEYVCTFGVDEKFVRMHNCKGMLSDLTQGIIPSCEAWNEHDINKYTKACMEGFLGKIGEAIRWVITKIKEIFNWIFTQLIKFINWLFGLTPQIDKKCDQVDKEAAAVDAGKPIESSAKETSSSNDTTKETSSSTDNTPKWKDGQPGSSFEPSKSQDRSTDTITVTGADMREAQNLVDQLARIAEKTYVDIDNVYDDVKARYKNLKNASTPTLVNAHATADHTYNNNTGINIYKTDADLAEGMHNVNRNVEKLYDDLINKFKNDDEVFQKLAKDLKDIQDKKTMKLVRGYIKNQTGDQTKAIKYTNKVVKAILDRLKDKITSTKNRINEIEKDLDTIQNNIALRKVKPDAVSGISTQLKRELELHKKIAKRLNCISKSCAAHEKINKKTLSELHDAIVSLGKVNKFRNQRN